MREMLSFHSASMQSSLEVKKPVTAWCEGGAMEIFLQTTTQTKEYCSD